MSSGTLLAIGLAAVFVGIAGALLTLGARASERQQVSRSLAAIEALRPAREVVRREIDRPFSERVVSPLVQRLGRLGSRFSPRDENVRLRRRLDKVPQMGAAESDARRPMRLLQRPMHHAQQHVPK